MRLLRNINILLEMYGMYLLHNDILYIEDNGSSYDSKIETHLISIITICVE